MIQFNRLHNSTRYALTKRWTRPELRRFVHSCFSLRPVTAGVRLHSTLSRTMSNYFFSEDAPDALKDAARDLTRFKRYLKTISDDDLGQALTLIHAHHRTHKELINEELAFRNRKVESDQRDVRQRLDRVSVIISLCGLLVAIGSFLIGRIWPTDQVSELAQRVAQFERRLNQLDAQVTTLEQRALPYQSMTERKTESTDPKAEELPQSATSLHPGDRTEPPPVNALPP